MKLRHIFLTALTAVVFLTAQAQGLSESQRLLGYIKTDSITIKGAAFGTAGTYTIGAVMTPQLLSAYAGCKVVGIRMAAALDLGRSRAFVYQLTDTGLTPVIEQKQRLYAGWNNILFNGEGYEIKGDENLFFGFDYTETAEMITADEGGLCCYGEDQSDAFYAYGDFGSGLNLYPLSDAGRLCVQLIIDVSSLPLYDIDITWFDSGFKYKEPGEGIDAMINYNNVGRKDIGRYQLGYQLDDEVPVISELTDSLRSSALSDWKFALKLPSDIATGIHKLKVFVGQVEGEALSEKSKNDTLTNTFAVYRNKLFRDKAYLEIYTDQTSPFSPMLNDVVSLVANGTEALIVTNVHKPQTSLALDSAAYLHELYAYTEPSFTINRSFFPGEKHIAYDMNDYLPYVDADFCAGILNDMLIQDFDTPSFASIDMKLGYDPATRTVTIKATGDLLPEAKAIYGDVALTLMVTENQVKGTQAVYNTILKRITNSQSYMHDHVLRAYITSPTGDALTAKDDKYEAYYQFTLNESWNPDNIKVVGLLTKKVDAVTTDNMYDMDIINANSASLGVITGIEEIEDAGWKMEDGRKNKSYSVFNLNGQKVSKVQHGLYIINGKKVVLK